MNIQIVNCFFSTDDVIKASIAQVFHAIATHSHDVAKNMATEFLPLVFLAMHGKAKEDGKFKHLTVLYCVQIEGSDAK